MNECHCGASCLHRGDSVSVGTRLVESRGHFSCHIHQAIFDLICLLNQTEFRYASLQGSRAAGDSMETVQPFFELYQQEFG